MGSLAESDIEKNSHHNWKSLAIQTAICGTFLLTGVILAKLVQAPEGFVKICYGIAILSGGWDAAQHSWQRIKRFHLDVHFLMLAVAIGALFVNAWEEAALLLFLFSTSEALENYVLFRTHKEIGALTKSAPKMARVLQENGAFEERAVEKLVQGDHLQVRPSELFPVDGVILKGESAADESTLTGESHPIDKTKGDEVFGGTLNLWGLVDIRVTRPSSQSALAKIVNLIENAQHLRAPSQRFTDRFGTNYTVFTLLLVFVMFLVWWQVMNLPAFQNTPEHHSAFYRAMTLLVVMSPCALVLSVPSAILAAIAWGARRGVLFRGGASIEKLAEVDLVAMDKTGTLTEGNLRVLKVESFPPGQETDVLRLAVSLDSNSNHPIARAVTRYAESVEVKPDPVLEFESIPGQGLKGRTKDGVTYLGRRELMQHGNFSDSLNEVPEAPLGNSEVWVLNPEVSGRILLRDEIRSGSKHVLKALANDHIRTVMLTGDRRAAATEVAKELGVAEVRAGLHPEDKVQAIQEFTQAGATVAMIGDGVNDAPSLAAADVSIAMGARGSDAALEQADIVLMEDKIEKFLSAREISLRTKRVIHQNIIISLGSVILMGLTSLLGEIPLSLGVLAHEGSTVIVCLNSLRILFSKERPL